MIEFLMLSSVAMVVKATENKHPVLAWRSFQSPFWAEKRLLADPEQ